jgi:radical SAM superfamily enzyme YgiQ (UPF0313 family)
MSTSWLFCTLDRKRNSTLKNEQRKYHLLLINPWIYDFTAFDLWSKPIGLLYIASYLRSIGYHIDYIDCLDRYHPEWVGSPQNKPLKIKKYGVGHFFRQRVEKPPVFSFVPRYFARYGIPEELFISQLRRLNKPAAVLVTSFMTYWYPGPQRVIEIVRQIFPDVPVILGGIYTTLLPEHARKILQPDFIITGPGEIQIEKFLTELLPQSPRSSGSPRSLDDFPSPAFDLYSRLDYLPVMTSRGCPYHCTFCATDKISGPYAQRKPAAVVQEILENVRRYNVRDVAFYDDALLLNKSQRLIPILEEIVAQQLNLRFHTPNGLHAKQIDREIARLFRLTGFTTIRLSFESADPKRIKDMRNKVTPADLTEAVRNLEQAGFSRKQLEAYVLMGLPHQSFQEIYQSVAFVYSLGIKIRLASFSPIPGTVDHQRAVQDGLFPADADPLLTNKTVFPLYRTTVAYEKFQRIRQLVRSLNDSLEREIGLFNPEEIKNAFQSIGGLI